MSGIPASTARPVTLRLPIARGLLYLLLLSFPFFSIKPEIFRPDWWTGGALIVVFAFSVLARGRFRIDPIGYAVLGFNAAVLLSTVVNFWSWEATQWSEFFTLWLQLVFVTLLYLALANLKLSNPQLRSLVRFWIGVAVVVALYGLYQTLARNLGGPLAYLPYLHPEPTLSKVLKWKLIFAGYIRPSSVLREPTYLANYLLAPLLITSTLMFFKRDRSWLFKSKQLNGIVLLILFAAFALSFALAGYITLLAVMLIAAVLNRSSRKWALYFAGTVIVVFLLVVIASWNLNLQLFDAIAQRFKRVVATVTLTEEAGAVDPSGRVRLQEVLLALSTWIHHPVVGVGLNQLQFVGRLYAPETIPGQLVERGYTHNIWLRVLVDLGSVGFFFFGLIWFQALRMMWSIFRRSKEPWKFLGFAFFFVLLATMIRGTMSGSFAFTLYWFYLAMASIVYRAARSEQHVRLG